MAMNKNHRFGLITFFILLILAILVTTEPWKKTPPVETALVNTPPASILIHWENLATGYPGTSLTDTIRSYKGFDLGYNEAGEQASWVVYVLTKDEVVNGSVSRSDNFRADTSISTGSASLADYRGSGYDRGHLAPAGDMTWDKEAMSQSFLLSNMSPQSPSFNRGIWADLEATIRTFAATEGSVYVVTGPVLTDGPYDTIGDNGVSIPNAYYKVVLDYNEPEKKAIGFVLPNEGSDKDLSKFATSVDEIEELTEIDFFPQLPDEEETVLESSFEVDSWNFDQFMASKEERAAYSRDGTSVEIPKKEDTTVTMVKSVIEKIMVQTKRELRSIIRSFDIPILDNLL